MKFNDKIIIILILFYYYELKLFVYNHQSNINGINYIKNLKKVVYTILLGKYDNVHLLIKEKGYDYFMITDQKFKSKSKINWTILDFHSKKRNKKRYKNIMDRIKRQRFYKTHPHLFFKDYDLSIYVDANYDIKGNLDEFLLRVLSPNKSIYILEHPKRNSINNEFNAVLSYKKDTKNHINIIKNIYNKEKFPDNNGLAETCIIVRKHNEFNCINFMENWSKQISKNSHRDQLSFNYILWKNKDKNVKYISKQFSNLIITYENKWGRMTIIRCFSFKVYIICRIDQIDLIGELLNNSFNLDNKYKRFKTSLLQYFPFVFF